MYAKYCQNYDTSEEFVKQRMKKKKDFEAFIQVCISMFRLYDTHVMCWINFKSLDVAYQYTDVMVTYVSNKISKKLRNVFQVPNHFLPFDQIKLFASQYFLYANLECCVNMSQNEVY